MSLPMAAMKSAGTHVRETALQVAVHDWCTVPATNQPDIDEEKQR